MAYPRIRTAAEIADDYLGAHGVIERLGFDPENIFCSISQPLSEGPAAVLGKVQVLLQLQAQGKKFLYELGFVENASRLDVAEAVRLAMQKFNALGPVARRAFVEDSPARIEAVNIIASLAGLGFKMRGRADA